MSVNKGQKRPKEGRKRPKRPSKAVFVLVIICESIQRCFNKEIIFLHGNNKKLKMCSKMTKIKIFFDQVYKYCNISTYMKSIQKQHTGFES